MTTDRTTKALMLAIALGLWSYLVVVVARAWQPDYSYDLAQIESTLDELRSVSVEIKSDVSDVDARLRSMEISAIFSR